MGIPVVAGATGICAPGGATLTFNSTNATVLIENKPVVTINNNLVTPAGTCSIKTAAANGVPQPCTPAIASPWVPGTISCKVKMFGIVDNSCSLVCTIGGKISVTNPGATKAIVK